MSLSYSHYPCLTLTLSHTHTAVIMWLPGSVLHNCYQKLTVSNKLDEKQKTETKRQKRLLELRFQCSDSGLQGFFKLHLLLHVSLSFSPQSIYPFQLSLSFIHLPL